MLILLATRKLDKDELKELHKHLNVIEWNEYMDLKNPQILQCDAILYYLKDPNIRGYWSIHQKNYLNSDDVIWFRTAGQIQNTDSLTPFYFKYQCKKIKPGAPDKASFIASLKQTHVGKVEGKAQRFFKKLLKCLLG